MGTEAVLLQPDTSMMISLKRCGCFIIFKQILKEGKGKATCIIGLSDTSNTDCQKGVQSVLFQLWTVGKE